MIRSIKICSIKIRNPKTFFVSLLVLLLSSIAFGQGGVATGDLHVTVKDPGGNPVANATVTVSDVARGLERTATGDGQGANDDPGHLAATRRFSRRRLLGQ